MEYVNIRNVNIWNFKFRGQGQTAKIWREGFKVSRFQIGGDKVIREMSTFEMSNSEGAGTNNKNLKCNFQSFNVSRVQIWVEKVTWEIATSEMQAFEMSSVEGKVKVLMWRYEVSYVTICNFM